MRNGQKRETEIRDVRKEHKVEEEARVRSSEVPDRR